eukprot:gb/GEZN01000014.1/.p1 GENE.gb/GEZN01000014.1/~~gb/GEZN01000014.1/.p1  ORF type:complete len:4933 (-),score=561.68 gb/GEZN01000014.1/:135-14933(-)
MLLVSLLAGLLAPLQTVDAAHWVYGTVQWERLSGDANSARQYSFNMEFGFTRSYFCADGASESTPSCPRGMPNVDYPTPENPQKFDNVGNMKFLRSDNLKEIATRRITLIPRVVYPKDDWWIGQDNYTLVTVPPHTYDILFSYDRCCRLTTILDGNGYQYWIMQGTIPRSQKYSPRTTGLPREYFEVGRPIDYRVPGKHAENHPLVYDVSQASESGLMNSLPSGPPYKFGQMKLNSSNGVVSWTPEVTGLFALQFKIIDQTSTPPTTVPLDFLMEVTPRCLQSDNNCNHAPSLYSNSVLKTPEGELYVNLYPGVQFTFDICAKDQDAGDSLTIESSLPPSGRTSSFFKQPNTDSLGNLIGNPVCYDFSWAPRLGDTDFNICFKAQDDQDPPKKSLGSFCVTMRVLEANTMYVSGILRDFRKAHPDFNLTFQHADDAPGMEFVASDLDNNGRLRMLVGPGQPSREGSTRAAGLGLPGYQAEAGFYDWFYTDPNPDTSQARNLQVVHSEALSDTSNTGKYTFFTTTFWPVDNVLFGNEGDDHNRFFTWEIRTYLTYNPGQRYVFMSADDMWVFVDGRLPVDWNLHGIHEARSYELNLDLLEPHLQTNVTYRCDIFYAHRSSLHDPAIRIELPNFFLCDGLTEGTPLLDWSDFGPAQQYGLIAFSGGLNSGNAYITTSAGYKDGFSRLALRLIANNMPSQSNAAYYGQGRPERLKLLNGFRMEFSFIVQNARCSAGVTLPCAEGFAVVLHSNDNPLARGGAGNNLGYGSVERLLAIEFDMSRSLAQDDPDFMVPLGPDDKPWPNNTWGQVSIQVRFQSPDGTFPAVQAHQRNSIGSNSYDPPLNLANGTRHHVRIDYQPGQIIGDSQQPGWLRVYVNDNIGPITEAVIDAKELDTLLGGAGFLGFTAANSDSRMAEILILDWKLKLVPVDAAQTTLVDQDDNHISSLPVAQVGTLIEARVQTQNTCGTRLLVGGEAERFDSKLVPRTCVSPETVLSIPAQDLQDGSYMFTFTPRTAATYDMSIQFTNQSIKSFPMALTVHPAPISGKKSQFVFGVTPHDYNMAPSQRAGLLVRIFLRSGEFVSQDMFDFTGSLPGYLSQTQQALGLGQSQVPEAFLQYVMGAGLSDYVALVLVGSTSSALRSHSSTQAAILALGGTPALLSMANPPLVYGLIGRKMDDGTKVQEAQQLNSVSISATVTDDSSSTLLRDFTLKVEGGAATCGNYGRINAVFAQIRVPSSKLVAFTLIGRDREGNLNGGQERPFTVSFAPSVLADPGRCGNGVCEAGSETCVTCPQDCQPANCNNYTYAHQGFYRMAFIAQRAGVYQLGIQAGDERLTGSPLTVRVLPGPACFSTTSFSGLGWSRAVAGLKSTFNVLLQDCSGNKIDFDNPQDKIYAELRLVQGGGGRRVLAQEAGAGIVPISLKWTDCNPNGEDCTLVASYIPYQSTIRSVLEWALWFRINNETGFRGPSAGTLVVPGEFSAALSEEKDCQASEGGDRYVQAGAFFSCTIRSKDRWSNIRRDPNPVGLEWQSSFSAEVLDSTLLYFDNGESVLRFSPVRSGLLLVNITAGPPSASATLLPGSPLRYMVLAGPADPLSRLSGLPTDTNDVMVVAGEWHNFMLTSFDRFGNLRDQGVTTDTDYSYSLAIFAPLMYQGVACVCGAPCPDLEVNPDFQSGILNRSGCVSNHVQTGVLTVEYRMEFPLGRYTLQVRTTNANLNVNGQAGAPASLSPVSPYTALVLVPAPTWPPVTELSGPGLQSCVDQTAAFFLIIGFDRFSNQQTDHSDLRLWHIQYSYFRAQNDTVLTPAREDEVTIEADSMRGTYIVRFTCPPYQDVLEHNTYMFSFKHARFPSEEPFAVRHGVILTYSETFSFALLRGLEGNAVAGQPVKWWIEDFKDVAHEVHREDSLAFTLELTNTVTSKTISNIRSRQDPDQLWRWNVVYTPREVGQFAITVFFNGAYESIDSQNHNYTITVFPGQVDPALSGAFAAGKQGWHVPAGQQGQLEVVLLDSSGHEVTDKARTVLARFSASLPMLNPVDGIDLVNWPPLDQPSLSAVWDANRKRYQLFFTISRAGSWRLALWETETSPDPENPRLFQASTNNGVLTILPLAFSCSLSFLSVSVMGETTAGASRTVTVTVLDRFANRLAVSLLPRPLRLSLSNFSHEASVPFTELPSPVGLPSDLPLRFTPVYSPQSALNQIRLFAPVNQSECQLGDSSLLLAPLPGETELATEDWLRKASKLTPYNLTVTPAYLDPKTLTVRCLNCPVTAGQGMHLQIETYDILRNAWWSLSNRLSYELLSPVRVTSGTICSGQYIQNNQSNIDSQGKGGYVCQPWPGQRGVYQMILQGRYTAQAWQPYRFLLKVLDPYANNDYNIEAGPFSVQAGTAEPEQVRVLPLTAGLLPGRVGLPITLTLETRDFYGNIRLSAQDDVAMKPSFLRGRLLCAGMDEYEDAPLQGPLPDATDDFIIMPGNASLSQWFSYVQNGRYQITVMPTKSGVFTFNISQNLSSPGSSSSPPCLVLSRWVQLVCMGPINPTTTHPSISLADPLSHSESGVTTMVAGQVLVVNVQGADSYGNVYDPDLASCPTPAADMHSGWTTAPQCDASFWTPEQTECDFSIPQFNVSISDDLPSSLWVTNGTGGVSISASVSAGGLTRLAMVLTEARTHVVVLSLSDGHNGYWALPLTEQSVVDVVANVPASFRLVDEQARVVAKAGLGLTSQPRPLGTAAEFIPFYLITTDAYGNEIQLHADAEPGQTPFNYSVVLAKEDYTAFTILTLVSNHVTVTGTKRKAKYGLTPADRQNLGRWKLSVLSFWSGDFVLVMRLNMPGLPAPPLGVRPPNLNSSVSGLAYIVANVSLEPFSCALRFPGRPVACEDRSCVADYSQCQDLRFEAGRSLQQIQTTQPCAPSNLSNTAQPLIFLTVGEEQCPCPPMMHRCDQGHCALDCFYPQPCPRGLLPCPGHTNNICRRNPDMDCPSMRVCTPGWLLCADSFTCVQDAADCPPIPLTPCPELTASFRCASGDCVATPLDCPTPITCPVLSDVLCPDGSCVANRAMCDEILPCLPVLHGPGNTFRCRDGSCRPALIDCGTDITCERGDVMCPNGHCATTVSLCEPPPTCPPFQTPCQSDQSCVNVSLLCPSSPTCPLTAPVRCAGGLACRDTSSACPYAAFDCPEFTCPDRSCAPSRESCPSMVVCPPSLPVFCTSDLRCVANRAECSETEPCPAAYPLRCPDGSCRQTRLDCPSGIHCYPSTPLLCPDHSCSSGFCPVPPKERNMPCPTSGYPSSWTFRCPSGLCAWAWFLCPTRVTCEYGLVRCWDGTCRPIALCGPAVDVCPYPLVPCPLSAAGMPPCVLPERLSSCPTDLICPIGYVRCLDRSCARGMVDCPPAPPAYPEYSQLLPCADGTWSSRAGSCGSSVTCSFETPFKCYDGSCRASPLDCPSPQPCQPDSEDGSPRYLCPNGNCIDAPFSYECTVEARPCPAESPIKCQDGSCVDMLDHCSPQACSALNPSVGTDLSTCSTCLDGWAFCPDSSCRERPQHCPAPACPPSSPFRCQDGMCAPSLAFCNTRSGCPYFAPVLCLQSGACAPRSRDCALLSEGLNLDCPRPCDEQTEQLLPPGVTCSELSALTARNTFKCDDGSCGTAEVCPNAMGCYSARELRCFNGRCELETDDPVTVNQNNRRVDLDPNVEGSGSTCLHANSCPASAPFKCSDGFCAISSLFCPAQLLRMVCPPDRPFLCAIGLCVPSPDYCPLVYPCGLEEERCENGLCRALGACPSARTCPSGTRRCRSGLCQLLEVDCSLDLRSGCSLGMTKCLAGECVSTENTSTCVVLSTSGCPSGAPVRCKVDGSCVKALDTCPGSDGCAPGHVRCTTTNGLCVPSGAFPNACELPCPDPHVRCADGSCRAAWQDCLGLNLCNLTHPVRCIDGSCRKYRAGTINVVATHVCEAMMTCHPAQRLCYDGSCQIGPCPAVAACPADTELCTRDFSCRTTGACDDSVRRRCPATSPILCPTGKCVLDALDCGACAQGGGEQLCSGRPPCPNASMVVCFDGACAPAASDCVLRQIAVSDLTLGPSADMLTIDVDKYACNSGEQRAEPMMVCADGRCVTDGSLCSVIARCPEGAWRCADGSCDIREEACREKAAVLPSCFSPDLKRCDDGLCRRSCLQFDGCSSLPVAFQSDVRSFHCTNRECGVDAADCQVQAASGSRLWGRRRLVSQPPTSLAAAISNPAPPVFSRERPLRREVLQQDTSPTDPANDQHSPDLPCLKGCRNSVKVLALDLEVRAGSAARLDLSAETLIQLTVPLGAIQLNQRANSGNDHTGESGTLSIRPVGESVMRLAANVIPRSRQNDTSVFRYPNVMTFAQTVVSPAFECYVSPNVLQPFPVNLTVEAYVDDARIDPQGHWIEDVCLARLFRAKGASWWICLYRGEDRRLFCDEATDNSCRRGAKPVRQPNTPPPRFRALSTFDSCTHSEKAEGVPTEGKGVVFAFITAPLLSAPKPPTPPDWVEQNFVYIVIGVTLSLALLCCMAYMAVRLNRYRDKWKYARGEKIKMHYEVQAMVDNGIEAGSMDMAVNYTENPMVPSAEETHRTVSPDEIEQHRTIKEQAELEADHRMQYLHNLKLEQELNIKKRDKLRERVAKNLGANMGRNLEEDERFNWAGGSHSNPPSRPQSRASKTRPNGSRVGVDWKQAPSETAGLLQGEDENSMSSRSSSRADVEAEWALRAPEPTVLQEPVSREEFLHEISFVSNGSRASNINKQTFSDLKDAGGDSLPTPLPLIRLSSGGPATPSAFRARELGLATTLSRASPSPSTAPRHGLADANTTTSVSTPPKIPFQHLPSSLLSSRTQTDTAALTIVTPPVTPRGSGSSSDSTSRQQQLRRAPSATSGSKVTRKSASLAEGTATDSQVRSSTKQLQSARSLPPGGAKKPGLKKVAAKD